MADVVSWQGVNSDGATAVTDSDVDTVGLWYNEDLAAPAVALPGAGDLADFYFDASAADYRDELFIMPGATLAPGAIAVGNTAYNDTAAPLYILKDLSVTSLKNYWYNDVGVGHPTRIGAEASGGWIRVPSADTDVGDMTGVLTIKSDLLPGGATTADVSAMTRTEVRDAINALNGTTGVTAVVTNWTHAFGSNNIIITRDATGAGKYVEVTTTGLFATTRYGAAVTRGDGYDVAAPTLTLTGATDPLAFDLRYGYWGSMSLAANSKIVCDNAAISFTQQSQSLSQRSASMMGQAGSSVEFTAVGGSVDLADPGSRADGNIAVGLYAALKVRSDQTWTGHANAFIQRQAPEVALLEAIDALPLNNMDQINLVATHDYPSTGTPDTTLPEGEYGSLAVFGYWHYSTNRTQVTLTGDVALLGEAVEPSAGPITGIGLQLGGTDTRRDRDYGFILDTAGNALDVTNGVMLADVHTTSGATDGDDGGYTLLKCAGSAVTIGGDLELYTDMDGNTLRLGVTGDASTVISLNGSLISNVKSLTGTYDGLTLATLKMLGGSVGSAETLEVCSDVALGADFSAGTGAIGTLEIGAAGDEAYLQLVDDSINDDTGSGEILLVKTLNIVNGQLDLNGESVLVSSTTLSIDTDNGELDLAAGVDQTPGVPYTQFAGVGDQTAAWDVFKAKVVDNSTVNNQTLTFTPFYDGVADRTYWQPIGAPTGIVSADSAVAATPSSLPVLGISTVQIVLVDTGGWPIVSLVDADFAVGVTGSGTAGAVTETNPGVSGVYTFDVTDGVVETVDVDVVADGVALNTVPAIDFFSVTIDTAASTVAYASGAPNYIPADGSVTTTLDIYIEDDLGSPVAGLAGGLSVVENGTTDSGAVFTDLGGGNYTAVYTGSAAGQYTLSVVYDFAGTPQTVAQTVVVDVSEYVEFLWLGVNTDDNLLFTNTDVNDGALWQNVHDGTTGTVPGAGALVRFFWDDVPGGTNAGYVREQVLVTGAFAPTGTLVLAATGHQYAYDVPLYIMKDLSVDGLDLNGYPNAQRNANQFRIGLDSTPVPLTLDVSGAGSVRWAYRYDSAGGMTASANWTGTLTITGPIGGPVVYNTADYATDTEFRNAVNGNTATTGIVSRYAGYKTEWLHTENVGSGQTIKVEMSAGAAGPKFERFLRPADGLTVAGLDVTNIALTLTGENPITFGVGGSYGQMRLFEGSQLLLSNSNLTLQTQPSPNGTYTRNSPMGGGGSVEFTAAGGTVTLEAPGTRRGEGTLGLAGAIDLKVYSDQTWNNASGRAYIYRTGVDGMKLVEALDALPLDNLGAVPFVLNSYAGNYTVTLEAGTYQGLKMIGSLTSGRTTTVALAGDCTLSGFAVHRDDGAGDSVADTDYGLIFQTNRRTGSVVSLAGNELTVTEGVAIIRDLSSYQTEEQSRYINASGVGSVLTIGGNLDLLASDGEAGNINFETRRMGITGDADTVVNLEGSFASNVRAMATNYNGLTLSTVNLLGGTVAGTAETFEVTADPADPVLPALPFDTGLGVIGVLNIGGAGDEAHTQLVDASQNDGGGGDEVLLVGSLNIVDGMLDCNGLGVKISSTTLSIDTDNGLLDLNTGEVLTAGVPYTKFFGVGDQAAAWNAFKTQVGDSTNPALDFEAVYVPGDDKTYWQPSAGGAETVEITAAADFNWVYPNTPITTAVDNHRATITIDMTTGGADTYTIAIGQGGGALVDFSIPTPAELVGWDGSAATTVDVAGGLLGVATPGSYTLNVSVTGDSLGGSDSKDVAMKLRVYADINDSGAVDTTDKLEINRFLNGIATTATFRELDLTGDGSAVDTSDKLQVNRVLNGIAVP